MKSRNRTWLAFANRKRCKHADAIHALGFISWRMGRARFAIGDVVYLFMSDERCVRFKMKVAEKNCHREDQAFWVEKAPNDITYKLELLKEYDGTMLSEQELCKHGFNGGRALETPNCNNSPLIEYITSIL
ncbi:MAG: hypothetical protein KBS95_02940 [Alistipes sp.]|nr:hypothetical protein [Candidatus Alistipes equi]